MSELGRTVKEWIGKTPDSPIPPRVNLRVLLAYDRRDYITGQRIRPGDAYEIDHIIALSNGGENRESNLAPVLVANHKAKTAADRKQKAKTDQTIKSHYGIKRPTRKLQGRGFQKTERRGRIEVPVTLPPPPLMRTGE